MNILIDKKTPYGIEAFRHLGEVTTLASHEICRDAVRDTDILVVRSETRVSRELLDGSRVRFVGTTTIGTDHIDLEYLASRGIGFASAPGSNANSVKEYVVVALLTLAHRRGFSLRGKRLGIVGVGNIGSRMVGAAEALGMEVLQNDPPLERQTGDPKYVSLDTLMEADFITLHVPLTKKGEDATFHLFDERRIHRMHRNAFLINTSRGGVVKTAAIKEALKENAIAGAVLDVWENEPEIDIELLGVTDLATPHIAGYSFDGKVNAVRMISSAVCDFFGCTDRWSAPESESEVPYPAIETPVKSQGFEKDILDVAAHCYDIVKDDARLTEIVNVALDQRGKYFARLRAEYPLRREFMSTKVKATDDREEIVETLYRLGFVREG